MASKNINVLLSLVDRFTAPLRNPVEKTKEMERQIKKSSNAISNFGKGVNSRFLSITGSIGRLTAGITGIGAVLSVGAFKHFADEAMELAAHQEEAEVKLKTILGNVKSIQEMGGDAVNRTKEELVDYAGKLQQVGVIGDEVTISGMQQLATFQLNGDQIKTLSGGMLDLLVQQKGLNATQEDAVGIANLIGKAMMGNVGALSRVGITLSDAEKNAIKYGDANQRAAVLAQVLKNNVGGVNEAMAQTPDGKIQQAKNAYGDMMEVMGGKLVEVKASLAGTFSKLIPVIQDKLGAVFDVLVSKLDVFAEWVNEHGEQIVNGLSIAFNVLIAGFELIGNAIDIFIEHSDVLIPILAAIVSGFVAFNVISTIIGVVNGIKTAMAGAQTTMAAFNAVMAANPAVLIALAIAALIALIVVLVMHWDEVKAAVESFSESAMGAIDGIIQGFVNFGQSIGSFISSAIDAVSEFTTYLVTSISDAINSAINAFFDWVVGVGEAILAMMMSIIEFGAFLASSAVEFVSSFLDPFSGIIDGVSEIFNGITDFIVGVFTGNWEQAISGLVQIFDGYFKVIRSIAEGVIGYISDRISAIGDKLEAAKNWITGGGGGDSQPDGHATGTPYFKGGDTYVNEGSRGELITLPSGSTIVPHDLSKQIVGNTNGGITVNLTINGNMIGNEEFMNECGQHITDKILLAMNNM